MKQFSNSNYTAMANAVDDVFGAVAMIAEGGVFSLAATFSEKDYDGGLWDFVTSDKGDLGFWFPKDKDAYDVMVPSNYYSNPAMPAVAFGAGLTLVVVNQLAWKFNESGRTELAEKYSTMYHSLFNFVFNLSEQQPDFMDGSAVAGFID